MQLKVGDKIAWSRTKDNRGYKTSPCGSLVEGEVLGFSTSRVAIRVQTDTGTFIRVHVNPDSLDKI